MYTVPIIPSDLRHEETIIQAASALDSLQKTINSVFERIENRIENDNVKLKDITQRIQKAQTKIKGLIGTKKAIRIYAPARFPATQAFQDIPVTFAKGANLPTLKNDTIMSNEEQQTKEYDVESRVEAPLLQAINEKLLFFHVRSTQSDIVHGKVAAMKLQTNQRQGLGAVPELRSVSSMLLFNTNERVYGNSDGGVKRLKAFKNHKQSRSMQGNNAGATQKQLLEPAPHSLANRHNRRIRNPAGEWRYNPKLGVAPEIDLPFYLPDLPGIADDVLFEEKEQQQIAPSLYIENLPELKDLEPNAERGNSEDTSSSNNTIANIPTSIEATIIAKDHSAFEGAPPPPPPPPPPPEFTALATHVTAPPPPPPPLPTVNTQTKSKSITPVVTDARSELMDAIRKAGGAKGGRLRAAAAAPIDTVDNNYIKLDASTNIQNKANVPTKPPGTPGGGGVVGNLMADLHSKLLMRRKGISGAQEKATDNNKLSKDTENEILLQSNNSKSLNNQNSVMSRLSALIPPPSSKTRRSTSLDDDENNEDDTDWVD